MDKDPAFLFYAKDFLTSTLLWSDAEKGQFIFLLCLQHQTGHLKKSDVERLCGLDSRVLEKFKTDESGCYYNEMLDTEIKRREKVRETKENAGRKSAEKRANKFSNSTDVQTDVQTDVPTDVQTDVPTDVQTDVQRAFQHIGTGTVNETVYVNETDTGCTKEIEEVSEEEEMFNVFWAAYPNKVAKPQCLTAFKRIPHLKEQFPVIMAALENQKQSEKWRKARGDYIPNPLTWIHQERWNNVKDPTPEDVFRSYGLPF